MEEKYNLTGEEINQILAHSPFALSDSPYQKGMGASQIKKYFYDFISVMAEKLNVHLSDVETDLEKIIQSLENSISQNRTEATRELTELMASVIAAKVGEHNVDQKTHQDIRRLISDLSIALGSATTRISAANTLAQSAYDLARGKSRVHVALDFGDIVSTLVYNDVGVGDFMVATDKNCPDFIVGDDTYKSIAVTVTVNDIVTGNLPKIEIGGAYYCKEADKVLIAIESGIDVSVFAKGEDLDAISSDLAEAKEALTKKQDKLTFDTKPTPGSENPITSGGVRAEFGAFSEVYDGIIDSAKTEAIQDAKSYTDEKIQEVSGGASKPKTYTLIEERTLTQDESIVEFTDLNLSSFYIEIMGGFVDGISSTLYMDVNGKPIQGNTAVSLQANLDKGIYIRCVTENDGCIVSQVTGSASGGYKPFSSQMGIIKTTIVTPSTSFYNSLFPFKTIKLHTLMPSEGTQKWLNGSNFKLWGIENDNN